MNHYELLHIATLHHRELLHAAETERQLCCAPRPRGLRLELPRLQPTPTPQPCC
ncbi:hypothetical protein [Deinococcus sedimenti]|uniref:Uncharacterized protein n=1 Tax=Deinococcus sedimenti TaxID=1867090 RepID=A0ABQ2S3G5_9DEIO|nr:hypothetical protein [Deinococcus sedimenti]GGR92760.1 hypothetical protein GCM10008960_19690 [Deinococcus sedimenti]